MIATLKLDPARTQLLSGFVDSYLQLNESENSLFQTQLQSLELGEEESVMEIVTSWMREGIEKGEKSLVLRLLKRRFGEINSELENRVNSLSLAQVESLAEALLDFQTEADLINYLNQLQAV